MKYHIRIALLLLCAFGATFGLSAQTHRGQYAQEQESLRENWGWIIEEIASEIAEPLSKEVIPFPRKKQITATPMLYEGITHIESEGLLICKMQLSWIDTFSNGECVITGRLYIYEPHSASNKKSAFAVRYHFDEANDEVWKRYNKQRLSKLEESKLYYANVDYED